MTVRLSCGKPSETRIGIEWKLIGRAYRNLAFNERVSLSNEGRPAVGDPGWTLTRQVVKWGVRGSRASFECQSIFRTFSDMICE